eukprot:8589502-Pyramimonas_sp.AAC.1
MGPLLGPDLGPRHHHDVERVKFLRNLVYASHTYGRERVPPYDLDLVTHDARDGGDEQHVHIHARARGWEEGRASGEEGEPAGAWPPLAPRAAGTTASRSAVPPPWAWGRERARVG